jgi:protein involved in polysaccharide export with SLBB domain
MGPLSDDPPPEPDRDEELQELLEALGMEPAQQPEPPTRPAPGTRPASGPFRLEGDQWVPIRPPEPELMLEPLARPPTEEAPSLPPEEWEALAEPEAGQARIIAVPVELLKQGEARYNIVIRPKDVIRVPPINMGEFYMMGHVNRPGVYSLGGREVTLMQGIAAAGGLDAIAWPSRCDIIRRFGDNREVVVPVNLDKVFAGQAPDVFLRPNDVINVGTHPVAPFMAVFRNAFRVAYGVSFVYDRNFADIDAYGAKQNPETRRYQQRLANQQRGSLSLGGLRP